MRLFGNTALESIVDGEFDSQHGLIDGYLLKNKLMEVNRKAGGLCLHWVDTKPKAGVA